MIIRPFTALVRQFGNGNCAMVTKRGKELFTEVFDRSGNLVTARAKTITKGLNFRTGTNFIKKDMTTYSLQGNAYEAVCENISTRFYKNGNHVSTLNRTINFNG